MIVQLVMFSWPLVVILFFAQLAPRRAVIWAIMVAWLFLPIVDFKVPGIPDYSKMTATCYGIMLGILLFDVKTPLSFRLSWIDLPVAIWCLCPAASSITNGLGAYDAGSAALYQTITWGVPYFIGRLYFTDFDGLTELAKAMVVGGLIYVPLCLFEIRMSPQLHIWVYGYHQHDFAQTFRYGGFRPTVFMDHGLMVGMWMCMTTLIASWLWLSGRLATTFAVPAWLQVALLTITSVLCKSTGAIALLVAGASGLLMTKLNTRIGLLALIAAAPLYMGLRCSGIWDGRDLVSLTSDEIDQDRSKSLDFRMRNEDLFMARANERPWLGWAGWGRFLIHDDTGRNLSTPDGLWVIALGSYGFLGLSAVTISLLLPALIITLKLDPDAMGSPLLAPVAVLATVLMLYMIDNLQNAMVNPIFMLVNGGLASVAHAMLYRKPAAGGDFVPAAEMVQYRAF